MGGEWKERVRGGGSVEGEIVRGGRGRRERERREREERVRRG